MNTNFIKQSAAVLIIAAISLAGCKSTPQTITMTTAMVGEAAFLMAGTGEAVIDWGDGSASDTVTLSAPNENGEYTDSHRYTHTFSDTTSRTILIQVQNITHLYCDGLQLTTLDVSKNTALRYLFCSYNQLTILNVADCTALKYLFCYKNRLTSLDITNNTVLTELICYDNQLTGLDVSKNIALRRLDCDNNELTSLDVTKNIRLAHLNCTENDLTAEGLNALFGTLHANAGNKEIYIAGNPGAADCNQSIATAKGWTVVAF